MTHWMAFALLSALFTSMRHLYIKKHCHAIPAEVLIFTTRLFGALVYAPFLVMHPPAIQSLPVFWGVLSLTVLLTAAATLVQIRVIQKADISLSVPFLSFIPLLMIPWTMLLLGQKPPLTAWIGLMLGSAGAYMLQRTGQTSQIQLKRLPGNVALLMTGVALALALTTTSDKIAIDTSSALTYAGLWAWASTAVMLILALRYPACRIRSALKNKHTLIQAVFWAFAFGGQMLAVQQITVEAGVVYVKMLTMLHILISVGIGGWHFNESHILKRMIAAGLMAAGAALTVWVSM